MQPTTVPIESNRVTGTQAVDAEPRAAENAASDALAALRRFARPRPPVERCELCGTALEADHAHLLDRRSRQITCACTACSILFCGQESTQFVRVPRRVVRLQGFSFDDAQWDAMMLPIHLAFFLREPDGGTVAMYPSPAGAMQSQIPLPAWADLAGEEPALRNIEPEVEALVVNRIGSDAGYYVVPVDSCYRLIGLIRTRWRGLSGGGEVWQAIAEFFADLDRRAITRESVGHA